MLNFWCQIAFIISLFATGVGAQASVRMTMTGTGFGDSSRSMGYDGLDRLISVNAPTVWGSGSFSYHALDNLTASTLGARNSTHTYDANNRLSTINTNGVYTGYSYDAQGNTTAKGAQGYYFDLGKRLILVSGVASYSYHRLPGLFKPLRYRPIGCV